VCLNNAENISNSIPMPFLMPIGHENEFIKAIMSFTIAEKRKNGH
jgi:hypothetical protein